MVLYDDLFNMRRQFYEESKRQWEEEKASQKLSIEARCLDDLLRRVEELDKKMKRLEELVEYHQNVMEFRLCDPRRWKIRNIEENL